MKITSVRLGRISVPLRTPFKTALRSVSSVEDVIVEIHTDCGAVGYGEAPPTGAITGDTTGAIIGAIQDHIAKTIIGRDVDELEPLLQSVQKCIVGNSSAKATHRHTRLINYSISWAVLLVNLRFLPRLYTPKVFLPVSPVL